MNVKKAGIATPVLVGVLVVVVVIAVAVVFVFTQSGGNKNTMSSSSSTSGLFSFTGSFQLQAAGSSFVNPIMQTWIFQFQNLTHDQITDNYQPIGSGAGITGIFANLYDYAGSDAPVPHAYLVANSSGRTLLQIPEALGSIAIFYNIPGVKASLNLTGPILAGIYNGSITSWKDARITALNPGVNLPPSTIVPVHRSDGSGTTYALTSYLATQSPSWRSTIGVGTAVNWPSFELASKGSSGVAGTVSTTPDSIGYADSFYAFDNGITAAAIKNSAGVFQKPSIAGAAAAASAFSNQVQNNATFPIVNAPGADSYPIATYTYLLVWANQPSATKADVLTQFFWWIVSQGQAFAPKLFYAPLPASVVTIDEGLIKQINFNGQTYAPSP